VTEDEAVTWKGMLMLETSDLLARALLTQMKKF